MCRVFVAGLTASPVSVQQHARHDVLLTRLVWHVQHELQYDSLVVHKNMGLPEHTPATH